MTELVAPRWSAVGVEAPGVDAPAVEAPSWAAASVTIPDGLMPTFALERVLWLSGKGTLMLAATMVGHAHLPLSGEGTLTMPVSVVATAAFARTGEGTLSMTAHGVYRVALPLSGEGTLTMPAEGGYGRNLALSGEGTLGMPAHATFERILQRTGEGTLSLPAIEVEYGMLQLSGEGTFSATAAGVGVTPLSMSGIGSLALDAHAAFSRTLLLSGEGTLALPAVGVTYKLFADDFNRADGPLTTPWIVRTYYASEGFTITSGTVSGTGSSSRIGYSDCAIWGEKPTLTDDQFAQCTITEPASVTSGAPGVTLASNAGGTNESLHLSVRTGGYWYIYTVVPGAGNSATTVLTYGTTSSSEGVAGDVIRLEKVGSTATFYLNGVAKGSYTGTLPAGRYVGIRPGIETVAVDDWSGGDL
ncbi:hypothetical protein [Tomitella cavernea]|uniref:Uncharacterized protein n=1 Tax=Tomitella cavernea TaxID=1387982 RepID=A0ABP9CEY3_9ACTN|nr:hypothetical protein [Tomitella cavernea]